MPKTIPSKPPQRPFNPTYAVTTTARVPGRVGEQAVPDEVEAPETTSGPTS